MNYVEGCTIHPSAREFNFVFLMLLLPRTCSYLLSNWRRNADEFALFRHEIKAKDFEICIRGNKCQIGRAAMYHSFQELGPLKPPSAIYETFNFISTLSLHIICNSMRSNKQ